jgi:hypothetical protein
MSTKAAKKLAEFGKWVRRDPKKGAGVIVGALAGISLLVFGGIWLKNYYDSLPKPQLVKATINKPRPTDPETNIPDNLQIIFSSSVAKLEDLDKPITTGITIKPDIKGEWRWSSQSTLVFRPAGKDDKGEWQIGKRYNIEFSKKLFPEHVKLEEYDVDFETVGITANFSRSEFNIDARDENIKKTYFTLYFNYPINNEDLKKRVKLYLQSADSSTLGGKGKEFAYTISFDKYFKTAYIESENIPIPNENSVMTMVLEKGYRAAMGGPPSEKVLTDKTNVPGRYDGFTITSSKIVYARNDRYEPEQILMIETSSPATTEDVAAKLKVMLLPKDHSPPGVSQPVKDYNWQSFSEVTPEVASQSQEVKFTLVPTEEKFSRSHGFKIQTEVNRSLYVTIGEKLRGYGGYELKNGYQNIVRVNEYPKELSFMSDGAILSLSGDKKLPMLARNIDEVTVTISRVIPDQVNHVLSRLMYESFKKPYFYEYQNSTTEKFEIIKKLPIESAVATQYFSVDLQPYLNKGSSQNGLFIIEATSKSGASDSRLILVTDLGVLAKHTVSDKTEVFVQNFNSGSPIEGATVEVIGRNGIALFDLKTNGQGQVTIPTLKDFKNEKQPIAFVVKRGGDVSYLPYKQSDRELQYSRFDIAGIHESSSSDQLTSMLFSDRGIYRPGETAYLGLIVRSKSWKKAFNQVPLVWSLTDPRGQEVKRERIEVNSSDLKSLSFSTLETSPTGVYDIRVYVTKKDQPDQLIGSLTVKVEEFVPDRIRISTGLSQEKAVGWIAPAEIKGFVSLKNLFGTAAEDRVVRAKYTLTPISPFVKAFPDYSFANPNKKDAQIFTDTLTETKTNSEGNAEFVIDLSKYEGLFRFSFEAEGFESEGGRSVSAGSAATVSSLPFLVGFKGAGDLSYIKKDSKMSAHLIAINSDHKKTHAKVKLALIERKYVSSLLRQDNGAYKYQSVKKEIVLSEKDVQIPDAGLNLDLPSDKAGDYSYVVKSETGTELNKIDFTVIGEANLTRSLERNSELQLVLNKKDFQPGEEIEMQIKAPYKGAGVITIERDEVYAAKWFKTSTNSAVEKIKIPEGLEGNAYINVTFLRAIDSKEIFTSPLSYAVASFSISLDQQRTKLKLEVPERVRPGEKIKIKYSADRKTDLILYGVDEGILQVAKYKKPDPLSYFFQKKALQVRSYQLLDLLMPEFSLLKDTTSSGGDEGFGALGKNLNPFKRKGQPPVAFWSGVVSAGPTTKEFTYEVPDYFNGNIKIMAVSAAQAGLGSQEVSSLVKGDFIITPSAPFFVAPSDEFVLGLGVSNQLEGSGEKAQVKVAVTSSDHFEVAGDKVLTLDIPQGREVATSLKIKAASKLGSGKLSFVASANGKSGKSSIEVSVRPAVHYQTTFVAGLSEKSPIEIDVPRKLLPEYRKQNMAVSPAPIVLSWGLITYLEDFPYACTEQLISKGFPSLILRGRKEFSFDAKASKENFNKVIEMLRTRQTTNGGFALYNPNSESDSQPASLYAIHYLTEARSKGYTVPEDMMLNAIHYLRNQDNRDFTTLSRARLFAYALYLQARNGIVPSHDINFLRKGLEQNFKGQWEKDATAFYLAGAYKLLKQDDAAEKLIKSAKLGETKFIDYDYFQDSLVRDSLLIYITAKHVPSQLKSIMTQSGMREMLKPLLSGQVNTHSSAHVLMAFDALMDNGAAQEMLKDLKVEEVTLKGKVALKVPPGLAPKSDFSESATKIVASGNWNAPVFYALTQSGYDKDLPKTEVKSGIEVSREYKLDGSKVNKVKLGEELTVHVRMRGLEKDEYRNVVLVDLLPGGFEVVMEKSESPLSEESEAPLPGKIDNPDGEGGEEHYDEGEGEGAFNLWQKILLPKAYAQSPDTSLPSMYTSYVDYREDRVVIYGSATKEITEFVYKIKATNKGKYVIPPTFAEGLYDRSVRYVGVPSTLEVE